MKCIAYVEVKYHKGEERVNGRTVQGFYILDEMAWYYLKVVCDKLKVHCIKDKAISGKH